MPTAREPGPRRSRFRRLLRTGAYFALGCLLLAVAGFVGLHTPPGRAALRALLEGWGSSALGGTLRLGQLELALWRGEVGATVVSLERPGLRLEAQRIAADWSPAAGLHLTLLRPTLIVTASGEPEPAPRPAEGLPARPWRALERIERAEVVGGRLELRDASGAAWLTLGRLDLETAGARRETTLRAAELDVGAPGAGPRLQSITAEVKLALDAGALVVERARLTAGTASIELHGRAERVLPLTATASARADFDDTLLAALAPGSGLEGRVEASADVDVTDDHVSGTLRASTRALTLGGIGPWQAEAHGRIDETRLVLDALTAHGFGGRIDARGPLALNTTAHTELALRADGLDVAALARAAAGAAPPLSARASGSLLWSTTGWAWREARGDGRITLTAGSGPGLKPTGAAVLQARGGTLALSKAHVEAHGARLTAEAELSGDGSLEGRWSVELPVSALGPLLADAGSPQRLPTLDGRLSAAGLVSRPSSGWQASASVRSEELSLHGQPLALDGELRYATGHVELAPLVLHSGSGAAVWTGTLPLDAGGEWKLAGTLDALELGPVLALVEVAGSGSASGSLSVAGPRDAPLGRASLRANAGLVRADASASPDEVALALEATSAGRSVEVERLEVELAGGRVAGHGRYDPAADALEAELELASLALEQLPLLPAPARRVGGTLGGRVSLAGNTATPSGDLQLMLTDPTLGGAALPSLSVEAHADGRELTLAATAGETLLRGRAPLEGDWPLQADVLVSALPLQQILDGFAWAKPARASVDASGTLRVELPLKRPELIRYSSSDLQASGRIRRLEWRLAPFALHGEREALEIEELRLQAADAWLTAGGRVALAGEGRFDLSLESHLDFAALDPALPARALGGTGELKLHVGGGSAAAELDGSLALAGVEGRWDSARWRDLELDARFSGPRLEVQHLQAKLLGGSLLASGAIPLLRQGGDESARLAFELRDVDLARALDSETQEAADSPSLVVSARGEARATQPTLEALEVRGQLTRLESKTAEGALTLAAPAAFSLAAGRVVVEPLRLAGPPGTLELSADGSLTGTPPAWSAAVVGDVDLRVLSPFLSGITLAGPAHVDARLSHGTSFRLDGSVALDSARFSLDTLNFTATQLTGELRLQGDRVSLEAASAVGEGSLKVTGGMRLGESLFGPAELRLVAERVPINYPAGFRGRASGELRLVGEPGRYRVEGEVGVRQAYYAAAFDAGSQSLERLDWQLAALEGGSLTDRLALDVKLRLLEPLRIRNAQLRLDVEGALAVTGSLAQPLAGGQITLREGGLLTIGRARVRVSQGRVELNGYPAGTPRVDLQGSTRVSGIVVDLRAQGSLDDLDLALSSDRSDLTETDLVSLVMTGRTASAAASQGGVVVAEELASALGGALQKGVGDALLIDVSPDRSLLTDDTDPTQRLNLGTRITQNTTVIYSAALDGTQKRWIVEFNPGGGRFRIRGVSEEDSSYSLEVTDRVAFNLWNRSGAGQRGKKEVERLASIRVEGDLPLAEAELRGATKLKPGRRYSALQREQAADRVRTRLVEQGWRSARVDTESVAARGGVSLRLRVETGPRVPITWTGDDPGDDTKRRAEQAWAASATPETAAAAVARTARVRLQAAGYYTAVVEPGVAPAEGAVDVSLRVTRGPKGASVVVEFDGNTLLGDATLLAGLPKPGSAAFFEALDPRSSLIANHVRLAYAGIGHLRARVSAPRQSFDAASGRLAVTIPVREGRASQVGEISLPPEVAADGASGPRLGLQPGQPFDLGAYVADRDAIAAWYRSEGWLDVSVRATLEPRGGVVSVRYFADAGPPPTIGQIRIAQNDKTRESLVRRSLTLREGERLRPAALAESRERLSEIGVYRSVEVRPEAREGEDAVRDVVVSLVDKPDVQVEYGVRYTTAGEGGGAGAAPSTPDNGRLQLAGALELSNPLGLGFKLRGHSFLTTTRQTWGVTLATATLLGRRIRTQLFVFDDNEDNVQTSGVASRVKGMTAQQSYALLRDRRSMRWHDRLRLQWGYSFKKIEYLQPTDESLLLSGHRGFASLALIGDERDSLTDPSRGLFWTMTSELARTGLGSDVDYNRLYGQLFAYVPLGPLVWAQGYRIGVVPGADPQLLIENRFRAGGPTTVRGFEQNGLGPRTLEGDSLGGQAVAVLNQELRIPIWKSLKGGAFWDAGNVWLTESEFDLGDLRQSVGLGLRYMFPFGPIRIEYAWVLKPKPGESKGRFVFGLGHAF